MRALSVFVAGSILVLVPVMLFARDSDTSPLTIVALEAITRLETEIDRIESQAVDRLASPPDNQVQQIELLGKLLLSTRGCLSTETRPALSAICPIPASRHLSLR